MAGLLAIYLLMASPAAAALPPAVSTQTVVEPPEGSPSWARMMKRGYLRAVRAYVRARLVNGAFPLDDDVLNRRWELRLVDLHRERVAWTADGLFHTCADFQESDAEHQVDVDFYARKTKGAWVVEKATIHKVDGRARFLYDEKNRPLLVP